MFTAAHHTVGLIWVKDTACALGSLDEKHAATQTNLLFFLYSADAVGMLKTYMSTQTSINTHLLQLSPIFLCLFIHVLLRPRPPISILYPRKPPTRHRPRHPIPQGTPYITLLIGHPHIDIIRSRQVSLRPGNNMNVHVRHRLACVWAVLHRDSEGSGIEFRVRKVHGCEQTLGELHSGEEVRCLCGVEIGETSVRVERANENVAWDDGFEVDEGVAVLSLEEDLWKFNEKLLGCMKCCW